MCSLFLVLRFLSTTAVRSIKKESHQRLLLWEVSVMQQRPPIQHRLCGVLIFYNVISRGYPLKDFEKSFIREDTLMKYNISIEDFISIFHQIRKILKKKKK